MDKPNNPTSQVRWIRNDQDILVRADTIVRLEYDEGNQHLIAHQGNAGKINLLTVLGLNAREAGPAVRDELALTLAYEGDWKDCSPHYGSVILSVKDVLDSLGFGPDDYGTGEE